MAEMMYWEAIRRAHDEEMTNDPLVICMGEDIGVYGVKTTIPYYQEILRVADFRRGVFDTGFVEQHPELTNYATSRPTRELSAVIAASLAAHMGL